MAVAAAPAASALVAMQANAAEIMAAQPQEIAQIADITPVFYVGFLVASLGSTLTTYIVLIFHALVKAFHARSDSFSLGSQDLIHERPKLAFRSPFAIYQMRAFRHFRVQHLHGIFAH
eukprot:CAMPEP_0114274372 /NCGR_PEP_ID=MMETSP0058-20121206/29707_1 /TAXON_ID=36894 /ORGANISM="Pyramimonas parkeae, CCMP726" /LENGTH=117 /DNA_ID=CAMNT_0001394113 /DNA_START=256 /DNA_END=609 /DNA_ORIENTATION=+